MSTNEYEVPYFVFVSAVELPATSETKIGSTEHSKVLLQ